MKKVKAYKYLGRNGILVTRILIEDAKNIPMMELTADKGMVLTDGQIKVSAITVEAEEVQNWTEIPADKED